MLSLRNVSIVRGKKTVVRGVTLDFKAGEIHVILGPNGSGKSTLAQGIMGIYPVNGKIYLDEEDITAESVDARARRGITLAFQEPARFEGLRVRDYLLISSRSRSLREVEDAVHLVGLPRAILFEELGEGLSGGERKRLELAAVYLMNPKFAVLDEPDSGIDMLSYRKISGVILRMRERGTGVVLISHNEEMIKYADVASIMCRGEIVKTGDKESVISLFKNTPCKLMEV